LCSLVREKVKRPPAGCRFGQVVNEDALVAALKSGHINAAGLDLHYNDPQFAPELAKMENVMLTTHIEGGTLDTRINFELNAKKNILAVVGPDRELIGEPLTPVNTKAFNAGWVARCIRDLEFSVQYLSDDPFMSDVSGHAIFTSDLY
jgi:hypothetical protein